MAFKKTLMAFAIVFFSINLLANDENMEETSHPTDVCDKEYSICMETCSSIDNEVQKELCYDDCDKNYEICLEKIQSE